MKTAYPNTREPVSITLYRNIPFDNTYKNHPLISSKFVYNGTPIYTASDNKGSERFLDMRKVLPISHPYVFPRTTKTDTFNFNFSNGLVTSVVMELTPEETNSNYMKVLCGTDVYYYFITSISQHNYDTYTLSLELDVLMTYQDEFLDGMAFKPVMTARKHCHRYTADGLRPYCCDLKNGDDTFANIKPSLVKDVIKLHHGGTYMEEMEGIQWLYVCVGVKIQDTALETLYECKGKVYPFTMVAIPINVPGVRYEYYTYTPNTQVIKSKSYTRTNLIKAVKALIDDGSVHGAKISPYPPFNPQDNSRVFIDSETGYLVVRGNSGSVWASDSSGELEKMSLSNNDLIYAYSLDTPWADQITIIKLLSLGGIIIAKQNDLKYGTKKVKLSTLGFTNASAPTITSDRYLDPKLLFAPFKKYVINAQYSANGCEFYPELIFSENATETDEHPSTKTYFGFVTTATAYIGDNNYYTKVVSPSTTTYDNYKYEKIGLSSSVNYIMPCGTNALDVFNSTQAQSFYQSKTASGITSGLAMAGGIGMIIGGAVGMALPEPILSKSMGATLIASGVASLAGGTASLASTIKSAEKKVEDLKNTPDSINISGSNFITDDAITEDTNGLPYIVVYDVVNSTKKSADDYFYNYGYQVARECYFNVELKVDLTQDNFIDNNLFGRTIFNYIQINEDITNKINADIPYIVKQKLSSIFNNGITIWNFFGFDYLWGTASYETITNSYTRWFLKCELDNTEYNG